MQRDAFLYFDKPDLPDFAQCSSCWLFNADAKRCSILSPGFEVTGADSCGMWGPPGIRPQRAMLRRFKPEEVGFVRRQVRCENCKFFDAGKCGLFEMLNRKMPAVFDLDQDVSPRGCCNAQIPGK